MLLSVVPRAAGSFPNSKRAFFQAGARAVIGNLWPVRDDEMETLMKEFSREVARGGSLAGALAAARRARIRTGAPPVAWAGLVVLGNGDLVLLPGGRSWTPGPALYLLGFAAGLLALGALVVHRRGRRFPDPR